MDSGCDYSLIPSRLVPGAKLEPVNMNVFAANGSPINILGEMTIDFEIEGMPVTTDLLVSDSVDECMLGYDWLVRHNIIWNFSSRQILFKMFQ